MSDLFWYFIAALGGCIVGVQLCMFMVKIIVARDMDELVDQAGKRVLCVIIDELNKKSEGVNGDA